MAWYLDDSLQVSLCGLMVIHKQKGHLSYSTDVDSMLNGPEREPTAFSLRRRDLYGWLYPTGLERGSRAIQYQTCFRLAHLRSWRPSYSKLLNLMPFRSNWAISNHLLLNRLCRPLVNRIHRYDFVWIPMHVACLLFFMVLQLKGMISVRASFH
jgi:hypothetical protein